MKPIFARISLIIMIIAYITLPLYLQGSPTYEWMFEYAFGFFFPMMGLAVIILFFGDVYEFINRRINNGQISE